MRKKFLFKLYPLFVSCYTKNIKKILCLQDEYTGKQLKTRLVLHSPAFLLKWLCELIYEKTVGKVIISNEMKKDNQTDFPNELGVVLIVKNEAPYIEEFIEYYELIGVSKIYLYDNDSDDGLKEKIQKYIDRGLVIYTPFPGQKKQLPAYNDAISRFSNECRYLAFIDADEFLVPLAEGEDITDIIRNIFSLKSCAAGIAVNWCVYGSAGHEKKPDGLVIENYLYHAVDDGGPNYHIKTICNPRFVKKYVSPHFPLYQLGAIAIDETGKQVVGWRTWDKYVKRKKLRLNHYFCKSREEAAKKQQRGLADRNGRYDWSKFELYNQNDIYDDVMLKYAKVIKDGRRNA